MSLIKTKIRQLIANPLTTSLVILSIAYLLLLLMYFILVALSNGINMDTYAANGTFQLYNPLRRLYEGQVIARDFPFFHGVGVPLLHYPAFYILGHNVFAAETVKWLISGLLFLVSTGLFFAAFFKRFDKSVIATALFAVLSMYCIDVVYPGNSLVGVRTTFPVLIGAFMLWKPQIIVRLFSRRFNLYLAFLFVLFGLSLAFGTEQGLAVFVAYFIIRLAGHIKSGSKFKTWWWRYCLEGLAAIITIYVVMSILTLGHANEALHYALIDIPKDQGWYFGAPPNDFLAWNTLHYILDEKVLRYLAPVIVLGIASFFYGAKSKMLSKRESAIMAFFIIYGIVVFLASITGYWAPNAQLIPLVRVLGLILIGIAIRQLFLWHKSSKGINKFTKYLGYLILIAACCLLVKESYITYVKISEFSVKHTLSTARLARHSDDYTYLSKNWKDRIDAFSPYITKGSTIWSTYTSVYDSLNTQHNLSNGGEDYIIHALGPDRREKYAQDFIDKKPDYAITLKASYFWYEEWLWSRNWTFYQELVTHYDIVIDNNSHILWKRRVAPNLETPDLNKNNPLIPIQGVYTLNVDKSDSIHLYNVKVQYKIKKTLPLADKVSRYLLNINGSSSMRFPVSLPPYESEWSFPVIAVPGDRSISFNPNTYGLQLGSSMEVLSMSYDEIPISKNNGFIFYDSYCSFGGTYTYTYLNGQYRHFRCTLDQLGFDYFKNAELNHLFGK